MKLSNKIGIVTLVVTIIGVIISYSAVNTNKKKGDNKVIQKSSGNAPAFNDTNGNISINYFDGNIEDRKK